MPDALYGTLDDPGAHFTISLFTICTIKLVSQVFVKKKITTSLQPVRRVLCIEQSKVQVCSGMTASSNINRAPMRYDFKKYCFDDLPFW